MAILVTNDDGETKGVRILLEVAKKLDRNAYAIVPHKQRSATSVSLTLHKPLRFTQIKSNFYTLSGTPADIVLFSMHSRKVPKPTLVLSGINNGDNCAMSSLLSSGTIGACWQAMLYGVRSIAFSIYKKPEQWGEKDPWKDEARIKRFVKNIITELLGKTKKDMFYNVTLPDDLSHAKIVYAKKLQRQRFRAVITKRIDPNGIPYYWLSGNFKKIEKDTDIYEVAVKKNVVITPVHLSFTENKME
jgi:5'-nucleotidase